MYKITFQSSAQIEVSIVELICKIKKDFDSLLDILPASDIYDKEFIRKRITYALEIFTDTLFGEHVGHPRSFCHITVISDIGQRFLVLPMLNHLMQFATSILLQPTNNMSKYGTRYFYSSDIEESLRNIAKLLCLRKYVVEFNAYQTPVSLSVLQHNEEVGLLQDEIAAYYIKKRLEIYGRRFGK